VNYFVKPICATISQWCATTRNTMSNWPQDRSRVNVPYQTRIETILPACPSFVYEDNLPVQYLPHHFRGTEPPPPAFELGCCTWVYVFAVLNLYTHIKLVLSAPRDPYLLGQNCNGIRNQLSASRLRMLCLLASYYVLYGK
jgi:hypothetical protein